MMKFREVATFLSGIARTQMGLSSQPARKKRPKNKSKKRNKKRKIHASQRPNLSTTSRKFDFFIFKILQGILIWKARGSHNPSRLAEIILLLLPKRNREHIIGDLEEEYRTIEKRFPRLWFWRQVLALVGGYWWAAIRR